MLSVQGLASFVVGSTLVSMERLLNVDTFTISGIFTGGSIGYMLGAFFCGVSFDRANRELQFALAVFVQAVSLAVCPFTGNVYAFIVLSAISAFGGGFIDTGIYELG